MTPLKMTNAGPYGDCFRTVIASLLDMPAISVPHFFETGQVEPGWEMLEKFLASHGLAWTEINYPASVVSSVTMLLAGLKFQFHETYVVLMGRGTIENHAVIVLNGEIVCDPAWSNRGITGPGSNGMYGVGLIVPLGMKRKP